MGKLLKHTFETEVEPYLLNIIKSNKPWIATEIIEYITINTIYSKPFMPIYLENLWGKTEVNQWLQSSGDHHNYF